MTQRHLSANKPEIKGNPLLDKNMYLPTTKDELAMRGWEQPDVILFSGDAYVDHPSFGRP